MFNQYKDDIQEMNINNSEPTEEIRSLWRLYSQNFDYQQSRGVNPLLSCNWDQGSSWNDMCPEDSNGPGGNVLVGCVAISMGQIMYYWGYPQIGSGDHAYNHWDYGYQYANFQDAFYDYSNMADNYGTEASALLLYHAGVSVNMGYGVDGSGAQVFGGNPSTYYAMRNYFLFKNTMSQIFPEDYSDEVYKALIHEDLDSNKPIIYVGYSNDGGHAWNIDGYDGDYFHCNWGWGGYNNGYFNLSTMGGFDTWQNALIDLIPNIYESPLALFEYEVLDDTVTIRRLGSDKQETFKRGELIKKNTNDKDCYEFFSNLLYHTGDTLVGIQNAKEYICLLYTSPSPRDLSTSRMPSSA